MALSKASNPRCGRPKSCIPEKVRTHSPVVSSSTLGEKSSDLKSLTMMLALHAKELAVASARQIEQFLEIESRLLKLAGAPSAEPQQPMVEFRIHSHSGSYRVERGRFCDQVVEELRIIRQHCGKTVVPVTFDRLRAQFPQFAVFGILSDVPFDDEDREIFVHPARWGRLVTYATGILKSCLEVRSDETIRKYRQAYRTTIKRQQLSSKPPN